MTLTTDERAAFVNAYTRALITSWSDATYAERLDIDPATALEQAGIELPAGAEISLVRTEAEPAGVTAGGLDAQAQLYAEGLDSGTFVFYLPAAPQIPTTELGSGELHGVAAGGVWDPYCCSCCPSCCSASGG